MKIIVPMAGRGRRFAELAESVGDYALPKPMIKVLGKPMVRWAVESFSSFLQLEPDDHDKPVKTSDLVFICLQEHEDDYHISDFLLETFSDDINIVFTQEVTRGPAETAMLAKEYIEPDEDIIISDCDHYFDASCMSEGILAEDRDGKLLGLLPLIKPNDTVPSWSYVVLDNENNNVTAIREKDPQLASSGAFGVIGAYHFKRGRDFLNEADSMIYENDMVGDAGKEEFYMSRIYQRLIERGYIVKGVFVDEGWLLGTPKHLKEFIAGHQQVLRA